MTVERSTKREPRKEHETSSLAAVRLFAAVWIVATASIAIADLPVTGGGWVSQGPSPIRNGQVEGIENGPVIGAIQDVVAHPENADIVWIGAANGGVWKTTNATAASPEWTPMGDAFISLSIGALTLDPTDGTHNTLVAGFGRFSNFPWEGGARNGLLRTTNGGTNWTALTPALLIGKNISGLAARGATIVAAVNLADSFVCGNIGIFRSINTGGSFTMISGAVGSGLPMGRAYDLAGDPTNDAVLYAAVAAGDATGCTGTNNGIYKSTNTGATWTKVSDATMDALFNDAVIENAKIAVGSSGEVYAGIVNDGQLAGLFRSGNGGASWTQLDTPSTNEGGTIIGMHPAEEGERYFSIVADPDDASVVYVGGDRQPLEGDGLASTPSSIGATDYSGRLFRVNSAAGAGIQSTPLTHCLLATVECNGTLSTENNSAPHAGSRQMVFDADGNLLEGDDGGLYRRTNPATTGDWFSLIGNLRVTEVHNVAYDSVSNTIITGNQDTGTSEQATAGGSAWSQIAVGTGGDVAVDDVSSGTQSTRYSSDAYLGSFRRRIMNASGAATSQGFPSLTVVGGGPAFMPQYVTPVEINAIDPTRLLFGGSNDLYESADRGDTIEALSFNAAATAMVYGGRIGVIDNADLIYALAGSNVFLRAGGSGALVQTATSPGGTLRDIAVDSEAWQKAYVVNDSGKVFWRASLSSGWTNLTGNLPGGTTDLRTIVFVPGSPSAIVVGGAKGVFRMATDTLGIWNRLGTGLPNAPVWDLDYDSNDDTLVAATIGRGVWTLTPVANLGPALSISDVTVTEGNAASVTAVFNVTLAPASAETVTVSFATADGSATEESNNFSRDSPIDIPAKGEATPYPSSILVSGAKGNITKVTVTLHGFDHPWSADVDVLLVGPGGQSVVLMSDVGGEANSVSGLELTIDDDAINPMLDSFFGPGAYKPTNIEDSEGDDAYAWPAPSGGYGSTMSVFDGTAPNGTWSLYVVDDTEPDGGAFSGWTLGLSTSSGDYFSKVGVLTFSPGVTSRPIQVTVIGDTIDESDENFFINLTEVENAVLQDAQGEGTIADNDTTLIAPENVVATATTPTSVHISWTAAPDAASYRVYRSDGGAYTLVGSPAGTSFDDTTALADTAYLYRVRSFAGSESTDSNTDMATTVLFTDPTLTVGTTTVKLAHFTELLTAVNAVRTLASLGTIDFTAPAPTTSVTIHRQHLLDLRTALDGARAILGLSPLTYTDPAITAGTTTIQAAHITEMRDGVK